MSGLKALRNRISSVRATRKITQAMRMVAASKLRRAQQEVEKARAYAKEIQTMTARLARDRESAPASSLASRLLDGVSDAPALLVVASGQRGLCGGFNSQIARLARARAMKLNEEGRDFSFLCVGRKAGDALRRDWESRIVEVISPGRSSSEIHKVADETAERVASHFHEGLCGSCDFFHSVFESVLTQKPVMRSLSPFTEAAGAEEKSAAVYHYEPWTEELMASLVSRNLRAQIAIGLLENAAGEEGARMTAMDNATRNADDMISRLSIAYNRTRQAMITKELVEIISGAEAL